MATRDWIYIINTFDVNTKDSNVKMLSLATDTDSKLLGQTADADILALYNLYHPVFTAYRQIYINYEIAAGNHQGETLNVQNLLSEDLQDQLRLWEGVVRSVYPEDSPEEKAIFPNKRAPFLQGTYEERISAVGALAAKLAADSNATITAYAPTVQSGYNLLLTARDTQQQKEGLLSELSSLRENQRLLLAQELWGTVLAGLMKKFKTDPEQITNYFDLSLLRETGNGEAVISTVELLVNANSTASAGSQPAGTVSVRMTALLNGPLEFGLSLDGSTFDGNTTVLSAPGSATFTIEDFASAGSIMLVKNQNLTEGGSFRIEFLG